MLNSDKIQDRLLKRLAELRAHVGDLEENLRQPLDDDFAEQAIDRADDEALNAIEDSALEEIEATVKALERLETGTYGVCIGCGVPISPKRLEAMPAATLCINCAD